VSHRKLKLLEKENSELKSKVQDMNEKYGEEFSEIDEQERRRLLQRVDIEIQEENAKLRRGKDEEIEDLFDID